MSLYIYMDFVRSTFTFELLSAIAPCFPYQCRHALWMNCLIISVFVLVSYRTEYS